MNRTITALLFSALVWSSGCGSAALDEGARSRDDKRATHGANATDSVADTVRADKNKRLQIVFMFGQSEMVGQGQITAASYMLQKPVVPPRDVTLGAHKAMLHQINGAYLYWKAMYSYGGPEEKKKELMALLNERGRFRGKFRQHVLDEMKKKGSFRGKKYRRGFALFNLVDMEAESVGITPRIRAILDGGDNKFNLVNAYDQVIKDSNSRYQRQLALNNSLLPGTTPEDFADFTKAVATHNAEVKKSGGLSPEKNRSAYAALAEKHLHMPVAKRTHIYALGHVAGKAESDAGNVTRGRLSVGYGSSIDTIGLEYAAGMALEGMIDSPILIVKCAWNNGRASIAQLWRASSLDGVETPKEKAVREAWNRANQDKVKPAPEKTGKPAWAWERMLSRVREILDSPGQYHPDYDPRAGFDVAGLIWFQGMSDSRNGEYALYLQSMLRDFRTFVKSPDMPVVCATVGTMPFQGESDDSPVNRGMREVANMPAFKGTIDVVETYRYLPSELSVIHSMFYKRKLNDRKLQAILSSATGARGRRAPPYMGSASFFLLAGNEVGARLARMIGGEKPVVPIR